jgi:hypothetical protein
MNCSDASDLVHEQMQLANTSAGRIIETNKLENVLVVLSSSNSNIVADSVTNIYGIWKPLIDRLELVVKIGNEVAEVCLQLVF